MTIGNHLLFKLGVAFRGDTLKAKCARGSALLGVGAFIAKVLGFGSKVVLARLLVPEVLGLMVLIFSLTSLFEVLSEIGVRQSVIQNREGSRQEYLNMAWWFQSLRGMAIYAAAFVLSPYLCEFYFDKPELLSLHTKAEIVTMVRTAFLVFVCNGLVSPGAYVLEKEFRFGKAVLLTQGGATLGSIITIALAFVMGNIWAAVIGFVSMGIIRCVLSFIICPFVPRLVYDAACFREIARFARGMFGLPILTYVAFNIDVLAAGKLVSADLFGMYGMAMALAQSMRDLFARIVGPVLLPAFSERQHEPEALCRAIMGITKTTTLFAIPVTVLAVCFSSRILSAVYVQSYAAVALPFAFLCVYTLLLTQGTVLANVFFAIGQPAKHRAFVGLRALILVVLIYPATRLWGLSGIAALLLFAGLVAMSSQLVVAHRLIGLKTLGYFKCWLGGTLLSVPIVIFFVLYRLLSSVVS